MSARIQIDTIEHVVAQITKLIANRYPRWQIVPNDLGDWSAKWDLDESGRCFGEIYYDISVTQWEYSRYNHIYGFQSSTHLFAFMLAHEFGHVCHAETLSKLGLTRKHIARVRSARAGGTRWSPDMTDTQYIAYRRQYNALPNERAANRVASLLTGLRLTI